MTRAACFEFPLVEVISDGFEESGGAIGRQGAEDVVKSRCRAGMRVVGSTPGGR